MAKKKNKNVSKGKWGAISMKHCRRIRYDADAATYFSKITFTFRHPSSVTTKWEANDSSLRIYYRKYSSVTDEPLEEAQHVDILPEDCMYYGKYGKSTKVTYKLTGFTYTANAYYNINAWLRVYNIKVLAENAKTHLPEIIGPGTLKKTYKTGREKTLIKRYVVTPIPKTPAMQEHEMFGIYKYTWNNDDEMSIGYVDFTDCITLPSYDVNREDVTESWDDANYDQHILVPSKKIKGKFSMLFNSMERYTTFMNLIAEAKEYDEWSPGACVKLQVQVNNELDYEDNTDDHGNPVGIDQLRPNIEEGHFTIKIDSNPWVKPVFGHFDRYSPINVTIEQVDSSY